MTLILAIATATPQMSVALGDPAHGILAAFELCQGRRHAEVLTPAIRSLCDLSSVVLTDLTHVAVDAGPGLFTGLRVGVATAKALASALDIPIVVASSLDLLAHPHRHESRPVASVVDARRGEVFWAVYRAGVLITVPTVASPSNVAAQLGDGPILLTGDGARRYASVLTGDPPGVVLAAERFDHPSAKSLIEIAADLPAIEAEKVTPTYMRGADVRIGWEQRHAEQ